MNTQLKTIDCGWWNNGECRLCRQNCKPSPEFCDSCLIRTSRPNAIPYELIPEDEPTPGGFKGRPLLDKIKASMKNIKGSGIPNKQKEPIPFTDWPIEIKTVALARKPEDIGIGDTIKRELGVVGKLIEWGAYKINVDCGCADKRNNLNIKYPYSQILE